MSVSSEQIIVLISLYLLSFSFAICLIYYGYKFLQLRNEIIVIKRRGDIVIAYTFCAIIILLFGCPLRFSWIVLTNRTSTFLKILSDLTYNPFLYFTVSLTVLRYWILYYDIKFSNCCHEIQWKRCIHSDITVLKQEQWYIKHRKDLGNASFMTIRATIITATVSLSSLAMIFMYDLGIDIPPIWHLLSVTWGLSMVAVLIITTIKMPKHNDRIYLYKECKTMSYAFLATWIVYTSGLILLNIMPHIAMFFMAECSAMIFMFIVPFISTYWVLQRSSISQLLYFMVQDDGEHGSIRDVMRESESLNAFMQYLLEEFSMECLLSVLEFEQFKAHLMDTLKVECTCSDIAKIEFADDVPLSDIVYKDVTGDGVLEFKIKAYHLYRKYIASSSEFAINISSRTKKILDGLMSNYDEWIASDECTNAMDLVKIFEGAQKEMMVLLKNSNSRFKLI
eukprot:112564_1